jgi:hypothetical protein
VAAQAAALQQTPFWQVLAMMPGQVVPLGTGGCAQLPRPSQTSLVQGVLSAPPAPAGQVTPERMGVKTQPPGETQVSVVQAWLSLQTVRRLPEVQMPDRQTSPLVQASGSLQAVPSGRTGLLHRPLPGSQMPTPWQLSSGLQVTGPVRPHLPAWQTSAPLHWFLSSVQPVPSQQGCPKPPQAQVPLAQARLAPQESPVVQQAWPAPPHGWQTLF